MELQPIDHHLLALRPWRSLAVRAGAFVLLASIVAGWSLRASGNSGFAAYYFFSQDALALTISGGALLASALVAWSGRPVGALSARQMLMLVIAAALVAYAGSWLVMQRYGVSRDEQLAEFATYYLRHGLLGWPIPAALRGLAPAMLPEWSVTYLPGGYWASVYLPVNSLFRILAGFAGDGWLAGPVLLAVGMVALWDSARRIWPDERQAATVTLVLALGSTQLIANAMTPYAMTGHFALNALWINCFLRGGRRGHGAAIAIGLLATGLHQWHFHVMFAAGFIIWLWIARRRRLALFYLGAAAVGILVWGMLYPLLLKTMLTIPDIAHESPPLLAALASKFGRLLDLEPITSLARFAAWQNVLLLPLAAIGLTATKDQDGKPSILLGCAISCGLGLAIMTYQGHGYGYRYLHGLIPCFCLLATGGWIELGRRSKRAMPASLLIASVALAWLVTGPWLLSRSHDFVRPYAAAYRAVSAAPADFVVVDSSAGAFLRDIVRFDAPIARPLILDLAYLSTPTLRKLCLGQRTMLFDRRQVDALGMPAPPRAMLASSITAARLREMKRLGCATPVPIPNAS